MGYVNDGKSDTAWGGGKNADSWWVELTWPQPVWFNQVIVDEVIWSRVKTWKILVGDGDLREVASADKIGPCRVIKMDKPVHASKLRLWFDKVPNEPQISEIIVQDTRPTQLSLITATPTGIPSP